MNTKESSRQEYLSRIHKVMDYIEEHVDQPMTLKDLADIGCFSPFHFHRIFSEVTGETPTGYIQRVRIEKAADLLCNEPETSITEIACRCGFSSLALFSRTFRKVHSCSPRKYRRESI